MTKIQLKESDIRNIIRQTISEAFDERYDYDEYDELDEEPSLSEEIYEYMTESPILRRGLRQLYNEVCEDVRKHYPNAMDDDDINLYQLFNNAIENTDW